MLRKRLIFTLIYCDGFFMQSRNFRLQKVGDINWLEKHFHLQDISFSLDELIILNASRNNKSVNDFSNILEKLCDNTFLPIAAGGCIRTIEDTEKLFKYGADKLVLNTIIFNDPILVKNIIARYGTQSIVASIDYKTENNINYVYISDGTIKIDMILEDYIEYIQDLGAGEIYLNSIDKDGTGFGYDMATINAVKKIIKIPLIISGGAGTVKHFKDGLEIDTVNAVSTANLFNFVGDSIPKARKQLIAEGMNIAPWENNNG